MIREEPAHVDLINTSGFVSAYFIFCLFVKAKLIKPTTRMKGFFKGLKYISQILDGEKEEEIEIGYPTDVKHVAHIGWEGPSVNTPSWMNQFNGAPKDSPEPVKSVDEDAKLYSEGRSSPRMRDKLHQTLHEKQTGSPGSNSPNRDKRRSSKNRKSDKHSSSGDSIGSATWDPQGSTKPRKHSKSNLGSGSPSKDHKSSRQRRSKGGSSGDGSTRGATRPSRSKGENSFAENSPNSDPGSRSDQTMQ